MSFFKTLLNRNNLQSHDRRPLWKYSLTDDDFESLKQELRFSKQHLLDARDAALYYAEWWKRGYNGGIPSKEVIFDSLEGNIKYHYTSEEFFKIAVKGGHMLGFKWIVKQNTLRFKTLMLQGGLPLSHIADNQGKYLDFLLAVLEEQPETIEDFIFQPHIVKHLPRSSQNDIIYENCFEIVRSILNKEHIYDELLNSNTSIKDISGKLKVRALKLQKRVRQSKPKNYWIWYKDGEESKIRLSLGLAPKYTALALKGFLGIDTEEREYQFYLNDKLICVFRKMVNGEYKTDWFNQKDYEWDGDENLPNLYLMVNGEKIEVNDFLQTNPTFYEPTLWTKYGENEWRLVKGIGTSDNSAALMFPQDWQSNLPQQEINLLGNKMAWLEFEDEAKLTKDDEHRCYYSNVELFDWTVSSEKPKWMSRANMTVIRRAPKIHVYDEKNELIPAARYSVWIRKYKFKTDPWQKLSEVRSLPLGCVELKIEKDGLSGYEVLFNIGNMNVDFVETSINKAKLKLNSLGALNFKLFESPLVEISSHQDSFNLKLNTNQSKIPTSLKGTVGLSAQKKLTFQMVPPFQGMALIDKDGNVIPENTNLSLRNLYGLRVLSTPSKETLIRFKNKLNQEVKITKIVKEAFQPLMAYKDEIVRLYYLADAMNFENKVCLELKEGTSQKVFEISGFSHTLNVLNPEEGCLSLDGTTENLELFGVPITAEDFTPQPLFRENEHYRLPNNSGIRQWIVISPKEDGKQLMPRFVNTDSDYISTGKEERLMQYAQLLNGEGFNHPIWDQLLQLFTICSVTGYDIPFSTFDQLRALSYNSSIAAKAFLFFAVNQTDFEVFIQNDIKEMEKDLGFCFHWAKKEDWETALEDICELFGPSYYQNYIGFISSYMQENGLGNVFKLMMGNELNVEYISHMKINDVRSHLGERVLSELPRSSPRIACKYDIPIDQHREVRLLLQAPIAVAESIKNCNLEYPIWGMEEIKNRIRRNIQYTQYLIPQFYSDIITHVLNKN